jgi:VanZ family protein
VNSEARLRPRETHLLTIDPARIDRGRQFLRLAWFACAIVVIVGSLLPDNSVPMRALGRLNISDKLQHFAAYAVLAFLPVLHERPRVALAIALALIGLGVLLEFGQTLVTRDFEFGDMVADTLGVFVGMAAGWPVRGFVSRNLRR